MLNINWEQLLNVDFQNIKHSISPTENQYLININDFQVNFVKDKNNFIVSPDNWIEEKITSEKIHEPRMISWLFAFSEIFKKKKIVFYEIGAVFGFHSFIFSKISQNSKIIAIEGNPLSANYISKNVNNNNSQNFEVINCVVDNVEDKKKFLIDAFSIQPTNKSLIKYALKNKFKFLFSNVFRSKKNFWIKKLVQKIDSKTIDSILIPYSKDNIEILKIDTEGHQAIFLPSSTTNLISRNAILLLELDDPKLMKSFNSSNGELVKPFLENGYNAYWTLHRDKNSQVKKISEIKDIYDCNSLVTLIPKKFI